MDKNCAEDDNVEVVKSVTADDLFTVSPTTDKDVNKDTGVTLSDLRQSLPPVQEGYGEYIYMNIYSKKLI